MIDLIAHVTPTEVPTGLLLFLAGVACGALATAVLRRLRLS